MTIKDGLSSQKKGSRGQERIGGGKEKNEGEVQMEELDGEDRFPDSPALHPCRLKKLIKIQLCPIKIRIGSFKEDWRETTSERKISVSDTILLICYTLL